MLCAEFHQVGLCNVLFPNHLIGVLRYLNNKKYMEGFGNKTQMLKEVFS